MNIIFCRQEYELLEAVQARLVVHPLTAPILGNDHNEFRGRESPVRKKPSTLFPVLPCFHGLVQFLCMENMVINYYLFSVLSLDLT